MTEPEIETLPPTEPPTETEEHVENPAAVLKKNRELLADLKAAKERASHLEELARAVGLDDAALADPRAHIAKRADESRAAKERERTVREAALVRLAAEGRTVSGDIEAVLARVVSDPGVKLEGDKVTGLEGALARLAPKRPAPGLPDVNAFKARPAQPAPNTFEKLVESGPEALASFARQSPDGYAKLRDDWQRRLANPGARR